MGGLNKPGKMGDDNHVCFEVKAKCSNVFC